MHRLFPRALTAATCARGLPPSCSCGRLILTCRMTSEVSEITSAGSQNRRVPPTEADKVPWWRAEDVDVVNARLARRLLEQTAPEEDGNVEVTDPKQGFDMKDVRVHAELSLDLRDESRTGEDDVEEVVPAFGLSYNLAAYVDRSPTLQKLVDLGVDLSHVESFPGQADIVVKLDFDRDVAPRVRFLLDNGVKAERLGWIFTKNPVLLAENLDDLQVRIDYLESKKFTKDAIGRIISQNAFWLSFDTVRIDRRLGFFQRMFKLTGDQVRALATSYAPLVTANLWRVKENAFSLKKEMGFQDGEVKSILLQCPRIFRMHTNLLRERFDYVHNELKFPHAVVAKFPSHVLNVRTSRLRERHKFLQSLGRAQYDPKLPNYVSPIALSEGTDAEFASKVARVPVQVFNSFLKTI